MADTGSKKRGAERRQGRAQPRRRRAVARDSGLPFTRANFTILAIALGVIFLGYVTLAMGSITLAPILLVLGYCVIVPWAILHRSDSRRSGSGASADPGE